MFKERKKTTTKTPICSRCFHANKCQTCAKQNVVLKVQIVVKIGGEYLKKVQRVSEVLTIFLFDLRRDDNSLCHALKFYALL